MRKKSYHKPIVDSQITPTGLKPTMELLYHNFLYSVKFIQPDEKNNFFGGLPRKNFLPSGFPVLRGRT